ncbi:uncharacterized protein [Spinacia oleracea]|uniref:Endonuclease/exonuclease/phosphatase domain-containing protein n=1 Tax=Spinacia oleracea TaxID=3562 RepID=A0ABM3QYP9_SPIOL|nr:uncharacterized protein LOC130463364 [Spinacia oleracea]
MIWNVQGAGSQAFLTMLREVIRINNPTILALVETHISGDTAQKVCDRIGFSGQFRVDAQGFRGGIWLFWRKELVNVHVLDSHTQHITVEISKVGETPWIFSAIYASPGSNLKRELWEALEEAKRRFTGPWILRGDFNDTVNMNERVGIGGAEMQRRCRNFSNWAAWINHAKFDEFVTKMWNKKAPIVPFQTKFATKLSNWNREVFHNIFRKKAELWARLDGVQKRLAEKWDRRWIKLEAKLRRELDEVLQEEEMTWFQKSRLEALKDGDRNTKYFHLSTVIRRYRNKVTMLQERDGNWITDPSRLKEMVVQYWHSLFTEEFPQYDTRASLKASFP